LACDITAVSLTEQGQREETLAAIEEATVMKAGSIGLDLP